MDPDATYEALLEALEEEQYISAYSHARNLRNWIDRGGFYPSTDIEAIVDKMIERGLNFGKDE